MHVHDAIDRLDQIHDQLTRAEVYRGFRVPAVASVGLLGFIAGAVHGIIPDAASGSGFVWYWLVLAGVSGLLGTAAAVHAYFTREDEFARRRTRRVMAQFLPCILAGGAITVAITRAGPEFVPFLPGLWAILFGLGVIATRPHLPPGIGLVGLGYVTAGAALLLQTDPHGDPSGWAVGGVFGVGHVITALVLWRRKRENPMADETDGRFAYEGLDRVLHEKARLGILTALVTHRNGLSFTDLARLCTLTDGNLSRHLDVLVEEQLVQITKGFAGRRPLTTCKLTAAGRKRFREYLEQLEQVLRDAAPDEAAAQVKSKPRPGLAGA